MSYVIAVAGKGGTGKTTIAALIIRAIRNCRKAAVLGIDADPNSNLGYALGIDPRENIGAIIDEIAKNINNIPAGMTKDRYIEYRVQSAIEESSAIDILSMGRPEGPGCYCYANNILRGLIGKISGDYKFTVIDNEAGLEHLSRRTTRHADCLFIISDATPVGLRSARRIYELSKELNIEIKKIALIINRAADNPDSIEASPEIAGLKFERIEYVPFDKDILDLSAKGEPLMKLSENSPALKAVNGIIEGITPVS